MAVAMAERRKAGAGVGAQITLADHLRTIPAEVRPTVRAVRRLVRSVAPKADEIAYQSRRSEWASMIWHLARYAVGGKNVVGIGVFRKHAALYFYRGTELQDTGGVLEGGGKQMRSIRLLAPADVARPAVKQLVRRAFALEGRQGRSR